MDSNNNIALSSLLRKFKETSYSNIDAKIYRDKLKTIPQSEWSLQMLELLYDIFGGIKIDDVAGFEGGYIGFNKNKLGFLDGGGGGGDGGGGSDGGGGCGDGGGGDGGGGDGGGGDGGGGGGGGGGDGGGGGGGGGCGGGGGGGS